MDGASNDPNSTGLTMLWNHYVFRRGKGVHELWDRMHHKRKLRLLYIAGRGFDVRAQAVMKQYVANLQAAGCEVVSAKLVLLAFTGYALEQDVQDLTEENARALEEIFSPLGPVQVVTMAASSDGEEDIGASNALRLATHEVLSHIAEQTDVVLDVSSLPRMTYLALLTGILTKLIPDRSVVAGRPHPLAANGVSFQVLVAEDARLDGLIRAEDPSNELVQIPGFSGAFHAETVKDWPLVWFPILGENRVNQLTKVLTSSDVAASAEICPVVPHPSTNPRRADDLLVEYMDPLFRSRQTPTSNIVYVHESNPFEAYRQLLFRVVRYLPVARYGRGHGTDLRVGVGQAPREETAGHAAVVRTTPRSYGDLSRAVRMRSPKSPFDIPPERLPVTFSTRVSDVRPAARTWSQCLQW